MFFLIRSIFVYTAPVVSISLWYRLLPAMSSHPKRHRIETAETDQNTVVKDEPESPTKMRCLNHGLVIAKVEPATTPERQATPAEPLLDAPAAPAAAAIPAQTGKKAIVAANAYQNPVETCDFTIFPNTTKGHNTKTR